MGNEAEFEHAWYNLVEYLDENLGKEKSLKLLDLLGCFFSCNGSRTCNDIKQIKLGVVDWYDKPEQRRQKK
jgi:hypothetical protein